MNKKLLMLPVVALVLVLGVVAAFAENGTPPPGTPDVNGSLSDLSGQVKSGLQQADGTVSATVSSTVTQGDGTLDSVQGDADAALKGSNVDPSAVDALVTLLEGTLGQVGDTVSKTVDGFTVTLTRTVDGFSETVTTVVDGVPTTVSKTLISASGVMSTVSGVGLGVQQDVTATVSDVQALLKTLDIGTLLPVTPTAKG
ncbi:MAG TPA: hypothetical protein VFW71_07875 [Actinomycetota bacterium]|nr:hypothetical protein [Actinomycetota bacterium]